MSGKKIGVLFTVTLVLISTILLSTSRSVAQQPEVARAPMPELPSFEQQFPQANKVMAEARELARSFTPEQKQAIAAIVQQHQSELDALSEELANIVAGQDSTTASSSVFLPLIVGGTSQDVADQASLASDEDTPEELAARLSSDIETATKVQAVTDQLEAVQANINQEVASLDSLSPEQQAQFAGILSSVEAMKPAVEADDSPDLQYDYYGCYYGSYYAYWSYEYNYYGYLYALYTYLYGSAYAYASYYYNYYGYVYAYYAYVYVASYCF